MTAGTGASEPLRFLFDQAADFRLIPFLAALRHDVTAVSRDYPAGISDEDVLEITRREGRIIVSADLDFGELLVRQQLPHAGVILLRLPGADLATKISRMQAVLREHSQELHCLIVVTEHAIRVRPPSPPTRD